MTSVVNRELSSRFAAPIKQILRHGRLSFDRHQNA
jgi:hypothetical protein